MPLYLLLLLKLSSVNDTLLTSLLYATASLLLPSRKHTHTSVAATLAYFLLHTTALLLLPSHN
jgi:hypothetical protein